MPTSVVRLLRLTLSRPACIRVRGVRTPACVARAPYEVGDVVSRGKVPQVKRLDKRDEQRALGRQPVLDARAGTGYGRKHVNLQPNYNRIFGYKAGNSRKSE